MLTVCPYFYFDIYSNSCLLSIKCACTSIKFFEVWITHYIYPKIGKIYEKIDFDIKFWFDGRDMPWHVLILTTGFHLDP